MTRSTAAVAQLLSAVIGVLAFATVLQAQQLTITSPTAGTLISPGQTLSVTVSVTRGQVQAVGVGGQDIGFSPYLSVGPYSFSLLVPTDIVGRKNLFAIGVIANETALASLTVTVDVEPSSQPASIAFEQNVVTFGYVGQQRKVGVTATFDNGSTIDVSQSSLLTFSSTNPGVISVDSTGVMTAEAPGIATITATFGTVASTLQANGPTGVKGDLDGDGLVTSDDVLLLESMLGSVPTGPNDARDINGDGKIDASDVQGLMSLCGPSCAPLSPTTTNLVSSTNEAEFAKPATLTATVLATGTSGPTGIVSFIVDGTLQTSTILKGSSEQTTTVLQNLTVGNHMITATYGGDLSNAPSASQAVSLQIVPVPGDVNGDGVVNCLDLALIKASFGTKVGQPGFNPAADVNHDGVVNILDLSFVAKQIPAGTVCQ